MVRGYTTIFQNPILGWIFIGAVAFMFVSFLIRGGLHAKKMMDLDSQSRKKYREEHPTPKDDN